MIRTARLLLRSWRPEDREPFAAMNADARVMEFMPGCLSRAESDAVADRIEAHFERHGFGRFAVESLSDGAFLGFIGITLPDFETHFTPCADLGWRLAANCWNRGLATEGARAAAQYAFEALHFTEVVAFTVPHNLASRRVMEKIGMTRDPSEDFDHPRLSAGHPLRRHVLYRLAAGIFRYSGISR